MTLIELSALASLIETLNVSKDNHDVITAVTEWIKGANPHSLTCKATATLAVILMDHLNSMNWDASAFFLEGIKKRDCPTPSIYQP